MREFGYVPNRIAGSLSSNRSSVVGLIVPSIRNSLYASMTQAASDVLRANGLHLMIADSGHRLDDEEGLEKALDLIKTALPEKLRETAYALACDVVASDTKASQEELRMLELIRHRLDIDRLAAAAIERAARAHYMRL